MKTIRGIYHDLKESEYKFKSSDYPIWFYFSSQLYRNKFASIYDEEVARFNNSINNVYKNKFDIKMDELALIRLYCLIEKRGFYIIVNGVEISCPEDLRFVVIPTCKPKSEELTN